MFCIAGSAPMMAIGNTCGEVQELVDLFEILGRVLGIDGTAYRYQTEPDCCVELLLRRFSLPRDRKDLMPDISSPITTVSTISLPVVVAR